MKRQWVETVPSKYIFLHSQGTHWPDQLDRAWVSNDGYSVSSRLLHTEMFGEVEHAVITRNQYHYPLGDEGEIPWIIMQEIKNELFGEERMAIEIFPPERYRIRKAHRICWHLWIFEEGKGVPLSIHPDHVRHQAVVNRGPSEWVAKNFFEGFELKYFGYEVVKCPKQL